jgi:hypothetical protein
LTYRIELYWIIDLNVAGIEAIVTSNMLLPANEPKECPAKWLLGMLGSGLMRIRPMHNVLDLALIHHRQVDLHL